MLIILNFINIKIHNIFTGLSDYFVLYMTITKPVHLYKVVCDETICDENFQLFLNFFQLESMYFTITIFRVFL